MPYTVAALGVGAGTGTSVATGVLAPTPGRRYFLGVSNTTLLLPAIAAPTGVAAWGLSWSLVRGVVGTLVGAWVYTATGTPTPGTASATWSGSYPGLQIATWEVAGTSGVVQSQSATGIAVLSATVPLAAFAKPTNATMGWFAINLLGLTPTPGAGFSGLQTVGGGLILTSANEWKPTADQTVDMGWVGLGNVAAIGWELQEAPVLVGVGTRWRWRARGIREGG